MEEQQGGMRRVPNKLLTALPKDEQDRIWSLGEEVEAGIKLLVYEPGSPIEHIYFPLGGVFSMVTTMNDGTIMEVATIGNEGMVGVPIFLGAESSPLAAFSQVAGYALRLDVAAFRDVSGPGTQLHELLHRYTQALFVLTAQSVACNRLHPVEQRCARWLLMTDDRVDGDTFPLTHEFLAQMLGVRRVSVTEVAGRLQERGLITYQRDIVTVLDRPGLEAAACECYRKIHEEFERMLG